MGTDAFIIGHNDDETSNGESDSSGAQKLNLSISTTSSSPDWSSENMDEEPEKPATEAAKLRFTPPDGGLQAWLVMLCSFLTNGVIFGTINSYGVIYVHLKENFEGDNEAATKASLVGSLAVGTTFFLSPVSSLLVDKFGIRKTALAGGIIAFLGMLAASFSVDNVIALFFTYGVMFGGGSSLAYTPSLVILGHYFHRHMGLVNGVVTAGSSVFTIAMPHILEGLISSVGLENCLRFLAGQTSILILCALSFRPLMPAHHLARRSTGNSDEGDNDDGCLAKLINVDNWKNPKYIVWCLAIPSALFGYFVPYVHIVQHVRDVMPDRNGRVLVTCIAITSGVGRLVFGKVADFPGVNRILLQQVSFVSIGVCTMLLTAAPYFAGFEFEAMIAFALVMGLFDGCFITMLGPIAYDICGPAGASQAIGFLLGLCSVPLTVGPPIAGLLYDFLGNYTVAFLAAGVPPILGSLIMCLIYKVKGNVEVDDENMEIDEEAIALNGNHRPSMPFSATTTTILPAESQANISSQNVAVET